MTPHATTAMEMRGWKVCQGFYRQSKTEKAQARAAWSIRTWSWSMSTCLIDHAVAEYYLGC